MSCSHSSSQSILKTSFQFQTCPISFLKAYQMRSHVESLSYLDLHKVQALLWEIIMLIADIETHHASCIYMYVVYMNVRTRK